MSWATLTNASAVPLAQIPDLPLEDLRSEVIAAVAGGARLGCWCGDGNGRVIEVMVDDAGRRLLIARAKVGESYQALTPDCPQAHLFERELAEQFGVVPEGHPWFKPLRYHRRFAVTGPIEPAGASSARGTSGPASITLPDAWGRADDEPILPGVTGMFRVDGDEVHEVAVGPVHAGVIEPGHFRFQCHGEHVFHLEIHLGYQHRGIEQAALGGPHRTTLYQMEAAAGDTSIGHAWAHCLVREALAGVEVPPEAQRLRALMLELERLANHTGDLGALAGDVGFQPTMSFNGRIRGDFLNLSAAVCGSRLGRGMLIPGGVRFGLDAARRDGQLRRLAAAGRDVTGSVELLLRTPSVQARFEQVGVVRAEDARAAGLVGLARRACGGSADARRDHALGAYRELSVLPAICDSGDVNARAQVRWLEIRESLRLVERFLDDDSAQGTGLSVGLPALRPDHLAVGIIEGWRGPVLHLGVTDHAGRFSRYKVVDPSFHNWFGLMLALRDEQVSDFPLCNKSFNLSYCGVDL